MKKTFGPDYNELSLIVRHPEENLKVNEDSVKEEIKVKKEIKKKYQLCLIVVRVCFSSGKPNNQSANYIIIKSSPLKEKSKEIKSYILTPAGYQGDGSRAIQDGVIYFGVDSNNKTTEDKVNDITLQIGKPKRIFSVSFDHLLENYFLNKLDDEIQLQTKLVEQKVLIDII